MKSNPNIIFLSISIDREKLRWKKSVDEGIYTSSGAVNLYTNGLRDDHPIIKSNNILGYPYVVLIG